MLQSLPKLQTLLRQLLLLHFGRELDKNAETSFSFAGLFSKELGKSTTDAEALILLMALVPHALPNFYDTIIQEFLPQGGELPEFGGVKGSNHRGTLPTGETIQFVLAGNNVQIRIEVQQFFSEQHWFHHEQILYLESVKEGEPRMSGRLVLNDEFVQLLLTGQHVLPRFGPEFPARSLHTTMQWTDLVVSAETHVQIEFVRMWLAHQHELMQDWEMHHRLKPGFKTLFYGPPGTGKTLTATLFGKEFGKPVYRIDLSQVVSKYIGETEKNLEKIFIKAEHKDWILFFDEADALFGKRTTVQSSHDRHANQEVSYLLQRLEDFSGLVILASNFKHNIDTAFLRRFNSIIYFPVPSFSERIQLWNNSLPKQAKLAESNALEFIARQYELSGANITNIMAYASLVAISNKSNEIQTADLMEGIAREYAKEDKMFIR
ncbi:ATP-binding protein [Dyadobacter sp. NIV53]|uniref:ATP-binding protein n=1 Tax=Dyadobacter sp. NIV53 TaxID=2861765 RepID=UPI001C86B619|nr:ATP-binding protein [Dyadobacter sp. NIV53]